MKPSPMLTLRLRRAGRDHGPSQLSSLSRRPEPNRGFNATAPVSPPGPGAPNGNTAGQGWCGVRHEAAPSQSIPLISSQRASSTGKRSLRGRELGSHSRWPWPRLVAHPEKLPGTSRRRGHPSPARTNPLSPLPQGCWKGLLTVAQRGTPTVPGKSAVRERSSFSSRGSPAGGWRGQGAAFLPRMLDQSRGRKKKSLRVLEQQFPCGPFTPARPAPCETPA